MIKQTAYISIVILALLTISASADINDAYGQDLTARDIEDFSLAFSRLQTSPMFQELSDRLSQPFPFTGKQGGDLECTLCSVAINEVEGFIAENHTLSEIETLLKDNLCKHLSGELSALCLDLANALPSIVADLENHVPPSDICQRLNMCDAPDPHHPDLYKVGHYVVDLDLPPQQRWVGLWGAQPYKGILQKMIDNLIKITNPQRLADIETIGGVILKALPEPYQQEIMGGAAALNVSVELIAIAQVSYELTDVCTSIVAQNKDGQILHARNLDFGAGMGFTDILRNLTVQVDFTKGGKVVHRGVTYVGFVGLLSAMLPGQWGLTINTRFWQKGTTKFFILSELVEALTKGGAVNSLLVRDLMAQSVDFDTAVQQLSNHPLIADVYFTISGVQPGQGVIVARNQVNASHVAPIDVKNGHWYSAETNYDWWKNGGVPWFDDRRVAVIQGMNQMTMDTVTLQGMLNVLSTKPVLNRMSTYSILMNPKEESLTVYGRYCNDPCPE
eukprot:TRINITY_DN608_c0_g1_i1.p1 TRINITY_DN608_c0_g1~~TRINITY_DN608_c0_g1_i1.p1  ORF type:complete len:536 (-),score=146.48 TRINITY_DN608_c0_g1_i1:110-1618(-)